MFSASQLLENFFFRKVTSMFSTANFTPLEKTKTKFLTKERFKEVSLFYSNSTTSLPSFSILKKSSFFKKSTFSKKTFEKTSFLRIFTISIGFYGKFYFLVMENFQIQNRAIFALLPESCNWQVKIQKSTRWLHDFSPISKYGGKLWSGEKSKIWRIFTAYCPKKSL